jgi:hypothetical protein
LAAARTIDDEGYRSRALAALAPHLDASNRRVALAEALVAAKAISDMGLRSEALAALAPHVDLPQRREVLNEAIATRNMAATSSSWKQAISTLAPYLDSSQRAATFAASMKIGDEVAVALSLTAIAPHLGPSERAAALAAVAANSQNQARTGKETAPIVLNRGGDQLLALTKILEDAEWMERADTLTELASAASSIASIAGRATISQIYRAVVDIAEWYP